MRLICISDTHGDHDKIKHVPDGDVLIHAGDCTCDLGKANIRVFLKWLQSQPHKHKVLIAGNHDGAFQKWPRLAREMLAEIAPSIHYLEDSGIELDGVKFWGSPYTPEFFDWYFMSKRGDDIQKHWDLIPENTEVLITHGPPNGVLDENDRGVKCGCSNLATSVRYKLPALKLHVFGHIHHPGGYSQKIDDKIFVNAAVMDENYMVTRSPMIVNL